MDEMRRAYGEYMPAYETVCSCFVPGSVITIDGKAGTMRKWWYLGTCVGLAAVYWDGHGGHRAFHS